VNELEEFRPKMIAIVSGKGGSGKTMVATLVALCLAKSAGNPPVILIDADTATAGLSYYLGIRVVRNIRRGLANLVLAPKSNSQDQATDAMRILEPLKHEVERRNLDVKFLPAGDHRRLMREPSGDLALPAVVHNLLLGLQDLTDAWIVVDCRGGIDGESLAVCEAADDILMIAEPDTTSFQASRHVVEALSDNDLAHKLRGFIINKAFEDPNVVARNGASTFGAQFLGAIPFDLDATRAFLVGDIPRTDTLIAAHTEHALSRLYPNVVESPWPRVWESSDYNSLGLLTRESSVGGTAIAFVIVAFGATALLGGRQSNLMEQVFLGFLMVLGVLGSLEPARRLLGGVLRIYARIFTFGSRKRRYKS